MQPPSMLYVSFCARSLVLLSVPLVDSRLKMGKRPLEVSAYVVKSFFADKL